MHRDVLAALPPRRARRSHVPPTCRPIRRRKATAERVGSAETDEGTKVEGKKRATGAVSGKSNKLKNPRRVEKSQEASPGTVVLRGGPLTGR